MNTILLIGFGVLGILILSRTLTRYIQRKYYKPKFEAGDYVIPLKDSYGSKPEKMMVGKLGKIVLVRNEIDSFRYDVEFPASLGGYNLCFDEDDLTKVCSTSKEEQNALSLRDVKHKQEIRE